MTIVVVPYGISRIGLPGSARANADSFSVLERSILRGDMASLAGDHRGRRPGHVNTGMTRELGRASSLPVHESADQCGVTPVGVHRDTKAPCRKGPRLRRVDPQSADKKRRWQVRRDELVSEGTPDER